MLTESEKLDVLLRLSQELGQSESIDALGQPAFDG